MRKDAIALLRSNVRVKRTVAQQEANGQAVVTNDLRQRWIDELTKALNDTQKAFDYLAEIRDPATEAAASLLNSTEDFIDRLKSAIELQNRT